MDLITPTRARELLERHGLAARRSLGQHFLVDGNTVRRIVRLAGVGPHDTVLEVGPGLGSLTLGLAEDAARVVALELDEGMVGVLDEVVGELPNVDVVSGDALRVDLGQLLGGPGRLIANLPYSVATPILARVLDEVPEVVDGLVMVQRELGERWCASPGSKVYGGISVKVAYHAEARVVGSVPPTVFLPPPKVASVLVAFRRRERPPVEVDEGFFAMVEGLFTYRRKTVRNALIESGVGAEQAADALGRAGIDPGVRPERLGLQELARLHGALR